MLSEYINQLKANRKSEKTIESYLYVLNRLNGFKPLEQITKKDLIEFFGNFKGTPQTLRLFQGIIKKFYVQNGKEDIVSWIQLVKIKIIQSDKDTLLIEDVNQLIESTTSPYWKAYISTLFECGDRFSEHQEVTWGDYRENILEINTKKTGAGIRRIPLIMSGGYLEDLQLSVKALPTDKIFPYSEEWVLQNLNAIAKAAGITKPVNPHKFRHARATDLVRRGIQEAVIRKMLGWTPNSTMIARYQHLNDTSVIDALTNNGDKQEKTEVPNIKPAETKLQNLMVENHLLRQDLEGMQIVNDDLKARLEKMEVFIHDPAMILAVADALRDKMKEKQ